ncbi:MAG: glycosyltransferase family 4 protein [Candidatus Hodarchaeota archaeon]
MARVLIDGIIYGLQEFGGISRYFTENCIRLGFHCNGIKLILHLPAHCRAKTPKAKWIKQIRDSDLRPQRIFRRVCSSTSKAMARMLHPQVFHSTYYTLPYWSGLRSVVTVHDFIHERFPALLGNSDKFIEQKRNVIESADAVVAVSHSTKDEILTYTKAEESKIVVIYHGVNDAFLTASPSEADIRMFRETYKIDGPYWLYIGNRGHYKNFGTLLRAFVQVARETSGYLVAVGGETKLEPWQVDLLIKNRLEQRVRLLHAMDDDDLQVAYAGATAFVFPSLAEGFGIPLLEAMAIGTPIVASDIPVFREVAGEAALFFDPYDGKGLATAMIKILDESVRGNLMEKGRKRVIEFSWDTASRKLGDVYKDLV